MTHSVIQPNTNGAVGGISGLGGFEIPQLTSLTLVAQFAEVADATPAWGTAPSARDAALRAFWPGEPTFASALFDTVAKYASFGWTLVGGPRTVAAMQDVFHQADEGRGWTSFVSKILIDLYTQDNGAFIEVVRTEAAPGAPVTQLNHLDAGRCVRTGDPEFPVMYYDLKGQGHRLPVFNVIPLSEMPSPDERWRGMQYCALTRCLRFAQIARDIQVYKREKVSGRFTKQIHMVSGMSTRLIEDAITQHEQTADSQGSVRFVKPLVLGTLDPTAKVDHVAIDLASLPDGYNYDEEMRWYITMLAMAFGTDYADFAPLPGRQAATSGANVTTMRSRGKGPAMFMANLAGAFNWHGVMPKNVRFEFGEPDNSAKTEKYQAFKEYAVALQVAVELGAITPQVARQMLADEGYIPEVYLQLMGDADPTDVIEQPGSERIQPPTTVKPGDPAPKEPPGTAQPAGGGDGPVTGAGAPQTPNNRNSANTARKPNIQSQRPSRT